MVKNKKCLILSRVSTDSQDLEQQTVKVKLEALKDGFSEDDIIVIEDKESGVILSEEERNGLNKLKEYVYKGNISCVYTYEVSRISRRPSVLYSIRDFLIEHKVQLIILNPYMKLLKDDFTLSETATIYFGIFSSLAEQEGFIRKQRFARGRAYKKSLGLYTGGGIPYGYYVDKDRRFRINEEKAKIVRRVFEEYTAGKSLRILGDELKAEGYFNGIQKQCMHVYLFNMIKRIAYTGVEKGKPMIILPEIFEAAQRKCETNRLYTPRKPERFMLKGLVFDKKTGRRLSGTRNCMRYNSAYGNCVSCNAVMLDYFVWFIVCREHSRRFNYDRKVFVHNTEEEIKRVNRIIETSQENIIREREILDRIYTNYIEMNISKEKADRLSEKHHKIIFEESQKIKENEEKLVKLNEMLNEKYVIDYKKLNLEEKIELCKKCINRIELDRGPGQYDLIVEIKFVWRQRNILHIDSYNKRVNSEEEFTLPLLYPPKNEES